MPRHSFAGSHYNLGGRHFNEAREELAFVDALEIDVLEREVKDERPATN